MSEEKESREKGDNDPLPRRNPRRVIAATKDANLPPVPPIPQQKNPKAKRIVEKTVAKPQKVESAPRTKQLCHDLF